MDIKFNDNYPKLHNQTTAQLILVKTALEKDLSSEFLEYDCKKSTGKYFKSYGQKVIILYFIGNHNIPFCTQRRYTPEKYNTYCMNIGLHFPLVVV